MSVVDAVNRDLDRLRRRDPLLADSALAATALAMAAEIDAANSATSKSMCEAALQKALDRLAELAPPERERDGLDDLSARRAKRRGAA